MTLHILLPQINFGATFGKLADADLDEQMRDAATLFETLWAAAASGRIVYGRQFGKARQIYSANAWVGHEYALSVYAMQACMEWRKRGYRDELTPRLAELTHSISHEFRIPPWVGNIEIHRAHRAFLLRQNDKYARVWPGTDADLPMLYPILSPNHIDGYYIEEEK